MVWLGGPFESERVAFENAEPHFEALIPKALSFALRSNFSYAVSELPGVVAMLERSGRFEEAQRVRNVLELMGQRIEEAV